MDHPVKDVMFPSLPRSDSLSSPLAQPCVGSFSSSSDLGKASKTEDTFVVGEYRLSSCPICLERFTLDNPAIVVICGHGFHLQCLEGWRQRASICPVCMKPLQGEGIPMMSASDTRRRRRYRGRNAPAVGIKAIYDNACEEPAVVDPMMTLSHCIPIPAEEHIATSARNSGPMWSVVSILWSLSRWCSRSDE